jgi:hypothetical protein
MVAQGITSTGGADWIVTKLLGTPKDTMLAQVRMCLVTAVFSSFVNDTPVVRHSSGAAGGCLGRLNGGNAAEAATGAGGTSVITSTGDGWGA